MELKKIIYMLGISAFVVIGAAGAQVLMTDNNTPQDKTPESRRLDSMQKASDRSEEKAHDAKNASVQSKKAVETEKKAQKARLKANEQEKKANESKNKSDNNY